MMPRPPRYCPPGYAVHVVQRGNNRHACFTCDGDIAIYAHWLIEGAKKFEVDVHAWVFMTNHVHLLLTPSSDNGISRLMQSLGRQYAQFFNFKYARTGTIFEGRFKSSLVQDDNYLLNCIQYIELNPVRAGMTSDPGDYQWSSYRSHAFGRPTALWVPHPEYLCLGKSESERRQVYRDNISQALSIEVIQKIRHCLNRGLVLGTVDFRNQIEILRH